MRRKTLLAAVGLALVAAGCIPPLSLEPLYGEQDVVFEPALVGSWLAKEEGDGDKVIATFLKSGDNAYELVWTEKNEPQKFEAHLVRLGELLFLDVTPEETTFQNESYKVHLVPGHSFSRVWLEGDVLRLALMDDDWLKEQLDQKKLTLSHHRTAKHLILTGSTQELQKLVTQYADDPKAFSIKIEFKRLQ